MCLGIKYSPQVFVRLFLALSSAERVVNCFEVLVSFRVALKSVLGVMIVWIIMVVPALLCVC